MPCVFIAVLALPCLLVLWNECCVLVDVRVTRMLRCLVHSLRTQQDLTWSTGLTQLYMDRGVGHRMVRHSRGVAARSAWPA
jgi:hypothetical protein